MAEKLFFKNYVLLIVGRFVLFTKVGAAHSTFTIKFRLSARSVFSAARLFREQCHVYDDV